MMSFLSIPQAETTSDGLVLHARAIVPSGIGNSGSPRFFQPLIPPTSRTMSLWQSTPLTKLARQEHESCRCVLEQALSTN